MVIKPNSTPLPAPINDVVTGGAAAYLSAEQGKQLALTKADVGSGAANISFTAALPFNGNKQMVPEHPVTAPIAFTVDTTGAIDGGQVTCTLIGDGGANAVTFPKNLILVGQQNIDMTLGQENQIGAYRSNGRYYYGVVLGVLYPHTYVASVEPGITDTVRFRMNGPIDPAHLPLAADLTVSGHTVTGTPSIDGAVPDTLLIAITPPFAVGETATLAYTQGATGNQLRNYNGDLLASFTGMAIIDNAAVTVPNAPTALTNGTMTSTTASLSWTASAVNGTHAAPSDYTYESSPAGAGTWTAFAHTASTATSGTITGLTAGTSYDFRVKAHNGAGDSAYSSTLTVSTSSSASYASTVLADSPVVYWRLNETSGTTAADASGNAHTGTYSGGVTMGQSSPFAGGTLAPVFDGSTGAVKGPSTPLATNPYNGSAALECMFTLAATQTADETVCGLGGYFDEWLQISVMADGSLRGMLVTDNPTYVLAQTAASFVTPGVPYHAVMSVDRSASPSWIITLYVNGASVASGTFSDANTGKTMDHNDVGLTVGMGGYGDNYFHGTVDEVALYNTQLSSTRVAAHYAARAS